MEKICEHCGKRFNAKQGERIYCSISCSKIGKPKKNYRKPTKKDESTPTDQLHSLSELKIIKGDLFNTIKRVQRTQDLLNFSQSVFWLDRNFSEEEELQYKLLIAEHFRGSKDIDQTFRELVIRTVLAKRWVEEKEYRKILEPGDWFDIDNVEGLYFTHGLYNKMLTMRSRIPSYQYAYTILSEAVLKFCDKKNILDIYSYREQFLLLQRVDLLQIFFNAVMYYQFINL